MIYVSEIQDYFNSFFGSDSICYRKIESLLNKVLNTAISINFDFLSINCDNQNYFFLDLVSELTFTDEDLNNSLLHTETIVEEEEGMRK